MSKKRLTADEARAMSGLNAEEEVDLIMDKIKDVTKYKGRKLNLYESFWVNEGYGQTQKYKEACKILKDLGYKVDFYYAESQFVDMYTIISW